MADIEKCISYGCEREEERPFSEISRRSFLAKAAKAGVILSATGPLAMMAARASFAQEEEKKEEEGKPKLGHRSIDTEKCVGCRKCIPLCPVGAIEFNLKTELAFISPSNCTECNWCFRSKICKPEAIVPGDLEWPRYVAAMFSDVEYSNPRTGIGGRGTEGMKTNDAIARFKRGDIGVVIEPGRPVLGARFSDVEKVIMKFKSHGYDLESESPLIEMLADAKTGALLPELRDLRIISCVIEFILPHTAAEEIMEMATELGNEVDSVFNLSVALRADEGGTSPFRRLFGCDKFSLPNGKVNLGFAAGTTC